MNKAYAPRLIFIAIFAFVFGGLKTASAQNLIFNGDFNASSAGWTTSCVSVEAWGFESTYGGPSSTNHVAEIDDEACMHQDVCVMPGYSYVFNMDASVRTGGGPNPCTSHIQISGLNAGGSIIATYVNMDYVRTNTTFSLTPVTGIPVIIVPACSGVVRLRVELTDNTPGYSTLGMIVDNLSLTYLGPSALAIAGPTVTCEYVSNTFSVAGVPGCLLFSWIFGGGAIPPTSTLAAPSVIWATPGAKGILLGLSNGVCADTLTYSVLVNSVKKDTISVATCITPYTFLGTQYYTSGAYSDTLTGAGGCDSVVTLLLTITPPPAPPVPIPATYCQFDLPAPLSATGSSLMWYGPGATGGSPTPPPVNTSVPGFDTFYVTQAISGCVSDSAMEIITIKPKPAPPTSKDTGYCQLQKAVQLSATGTDLQWYNAPTGGLPQATAPVPSTTLGGAIHWYVSQTVNGCESDRTPVTVTVAFTPVFNISTDKLNVCINDTVKLAFSGTGSFSGYEWSLGSANDIIFGSLKSPLIYVVWPVSGYQFVYLKVSDSAGVCSAIDTIRLNVVPTPAAAISTPNGVCLGDTVTLALGAHTSNADSFFWYVDNEPLLQSGGLNIVTSNANTGGPFGIFWTTAGLHLINMYTITKEGCKSPVVTDSVKVNNLPNAAFTVQTKSELCLEDSVFFQASETGYGYGYLWSPTRFFNNINEPSAWGKMDDLKSTVSLSVTDAFGCVASTSQELDPSTCCRIDFPNAFTPNGVHNNLFRPLGSGFHKFHKFQIANRWGQIVFESANSNFQWDGNYNGIPQDMDVYYYILWYDCGGSTLTQKGDVTLIR